MEQQHQRRTPWPLTTPQTVHPHQQSPSSLALPKGLHDRKSNRPLGLNGTRQNKPTLPTDEKNQGGNSDHITLEDWEEEWTCTDKSSNSPQQRNGNDCRKFILVLLALLSQGIRLQTGSYPQDLIYLQQPHRRIAYLIWSSSLGDPQMP